MKRSSIGLRIAIGVFMVLALLGAFIHWKVYLPWNFPAQMETNAKSEENWNWTPREECEHPPLLDVIFELDRSPTGRIYDAPQDNVEEALLELQKSDTPEDKVKLERLEENLYLDKLIMEDMDEEAIKLHEPVTIGEYVKISALACNDCYWRIRCLVDGKLVAWSERIYPQYPHFLAVGFTWDTSSYEPGVHWITLEYIPKWYYFPLSKWHSINRIYREEIEFTIYPKGTRRGQYGELIVPHD